MKVYRYSAYPPEFYRFKGTRAPRGLGCGPIAEDAGLWNLSWLSKESTFKAYEDAENEDNLGMWSAIGLEYIAKLGNTIVAGQKLRVLAARMTAVNLLHTMKQSPPTTPGPYDKVEWAPWMAFAVYRAQSAYNSPVDIAEFKPVRAYDALAEEAKQASVVVKRMPEPSLPVFTTTTPGEEIDVDAWMAKLKTGSIH